MVPFIIIIFFWVRYPLKSKPRHSIGFNLDRLIKFNGYQLPVEHVSI